MVEAMKPPAGFQRLILAAGRLMLACSRLRLVAPTARVTPTVGRQFRFVSRHSLVQKSTHIMT